MNITVSAASAVLSSSEPLTRGMVGKTLSASFSAEWASLTIVACFVQEDTEIDVSVTLDSDRAATITIPWEVLATANKLCRVGFYGVSGTTTVIPTVWVNLGLVMDSPDPNGETPSSHTQAIWDTKQDTISDLATIRANAATGAALATDVASNTAARHTHSNKAVLDGIAASDVTNWNGKLSDAPSDNKQYARKNGAWAEVEGGSGGTGDFDELENRPSYAGAAMTHSTAIPEVKTSTWDAKQDAISDLATIRANASTGAGLASDVAANTSARHTHSNKSVLDGITAALITAWNGAVTWVTTNGASVLTHIADTIVHITAAERTAWNAKYDKPSGGIPKTDLASAVQTSLGKADESLGSDSLNGDAEEYIEATLSHISDHENSTVYRVPQGTYSKPSTGIPKSDLASAVQTSLGLADSALQAVPATYRTAAAQDTIDSGKEAKGKMTISGTEYSVVKHTLSITSGGTTTTYNLLGV